MFLPRPYPDELVGSMLNRAERMLGMGRMELLSRLAGEHLTAHSFLMTTFSGVARSHGMSLEEFLRAHTVLPYVAAFMSRQEGRRVMAMLVNGHHPRGRHAALTLRTSLEGQQLRLCPICVEEEMLLYGESYWHRAHQLSGVEVCEKHNADLLLTEFVVSRAPHIPPPHEAGVLLRPTGSDTSDEARWAVACVSALLLRSTCDQELLTQEYRTQGSLLGYLSQAGAVRQAQLLRDLRTYYGEQYLAKCGCAFDDGKRCQWPTKLLIESAQVATGLKHVLLMAFFERGLLSLPAMPDRKKFL